MKESEEESVIALTGILILDEVMWGTIDVKIKGLTALLMNRLTVERLRPHGPKPPGAEYDPEEEARLSAYIEVIDGVEQLCIPSICLYSCIIGASGGYKIGKKTARTVLAGTIRIQPENVPLKPAFVDGKPNYEVDLRPVRIQKARIVRARAKVWPWEASFQIRYYRKFMKKDDVGAIREILESAGITQGIMDYRPQHQGWFGTFEVTNFEVIN